MLGLVEPPATETIAVPTQVGPLSVARTGQGPPLVLWHSLFVDQRSWWRVVPSLAAAHTVYSIDGPGHGNSPGPARDFTLDDCASAAVEVMRHFDLSTVDWVGNAWGGHVGVVLAARGDGALRSLAVLSSPMQPLAGRERLQIRALVGLFRLLGWRRFLLGAVSGSLLDPDVASRHPELPRYVQEAARSQGRQAMLHAMRSVMLGRPSLVPLLPRLALPVLFVTTEGSALWPVAVASAHAAAVPGARLEVLSHTRHLPPLEAPEPTAALLLAWLDEMSRRATPPA